MSANNNDTTVRWYVMRDLKRANALLPAYKMLAEKGFEVFTPMIWQLSVKNSKHIRKLIPFMHDLLFVHDTRQNIDPVAAVTPTLQYRFMRHGYCEPMYVRDEDMERFIYAVNNAGNVRYYLPDELTPKMLNRQIRIIGGPMNGYEGKLLTVRGSKTKRLLVELPGLLIVSVEVQPDFIQLL